MPVFRRVFSDAAAQLSRRIAFAARLDCVRCPIGLRSVSDWIAFAARLDCVRRPIRLRSPSDQIAFGVRRLGVSFLTVGGECVKTHE